MFDFLLSTKKRIVEVLQAYYPFKIDSLDYSGNVLDAISTNVLYDGTKADLDGTAYIIPPSDIIGIGDFALSVKFMTRDSLKFAQGIFCNAGVYGGYAGSLVFFYQNSTLYCRVGNSSDSETVVFNADVSYFIFENTEHYIELSRVGATYTLTIDNIIVNTYLKNVPVAIASGSTNIIGARNLTGGLDGTLRDFKVY